MSYRTVSEIRLPACPPSESPFRLILTNTHGIEQEYHLTRADLLALNTWLSRLNLKEP